MATTKKTKQKPREPKRVRCTPAAAQILDALARIEAAIAVLRSEVEELKYDVSSGTLLQLAAQADPE